jgi:hypothetical protein
MLSRASEEREGAGRITLIENELSLKNQKRYSISLGNIEILELI